MIHYESGDGDKLGLTSGFVLFYGTVKLLHVLQSIKGSTLTGRNVRLSNLLISFVIIDNLSSN